MLQRFMDLTMHDESDIIFRNKTKRTCDIKRFNNNFQYIKKCENFNEDICSICLQIEENDNFIKTKCNHVFHYSCMEKWITSTETPNCPNCKEKFEISVIDFKVDKLDKNELLIYNNLNRLLINDTTQYCNYSNRLNIQNILKLFSEEEVSVGIYSNRFNHSKVMNVSIDLIKWFVNINLVNMSFELYKSYLKIKTKNNTEHFDISKNQYKSKLVIYEFDEHHVEITIAQSNFLLWFINNNIFDKIIDCRNLMPQKFKT
jgi:hypothetical protein